MKPSKVPDKKPTKGQPEKGKSKGKPIDKKGKPMMKGC